MALADHDGNGSLMRAITALEKCGEALVAEQALHPVVLWLRGLGSFGTSVLFFNIASEPPDHMGVLAQTVRSVFAGVGSAHDRRPFTPHLTVMKASRMPRDQGGTGPRGTIEKALYEEIAGGQVGPCRVDSLQLCSMARQPDDGYYPVVASLCLEVGEVTVCDGWRARFGAWRERL